MRMKTLFLSLLLTVSTALFAYEQRLDAEYIASLGMPVMYINTVGGEVPTCDFVYAPEGQDGVTSANENKVPSRILIVDGDNVLYDSGEYLKDESGATVKVRGNTSAFFGAIKPYKIKLSKKADLLSRGDNCYKDKEWVLLNEYTLRPMIGCKVNELLGMQWTPQCMFVNVILNGDFQGLYVLIESVKRNADARLNVDKSSGFIFEHDPYWWSEPLSFRTDVLNVKYAYTFKYPDDEDITQQQVDYIRQTMNNMERSIADGTYDQTMDVGSFAAWVLGHDILGTRDSGGSNMYLTKYDDTPDSRVMMANMWDFDSTLEKDQTWASIHSRWYFQHLFASANASFVSEYVRLWRENHNRIFSELDEWLQQWAESDRLQGVFDSRTSYEYKWDPRFNYDERDDWDPQIEIERTRKWFSDRHAWLNQHIEQEYGAIADGIVDVHAEASDADTRLYDLSGRPASEHTRGVLIGRGRKIVRR